MHLIPQSLISPLQRKSQLAIEYSYQVRDLSPETWFFWVHASNSARLEQSYRDIADRVKIQGREDPKSDIFKLVQDWLCDGKDRKWCLILDNLDDDRFVLSVSNSNSGVLNRPLLAYLPQSPNGSILISTRSRDVATRFVGERDIVAVEPMDNAHAMMLFEKKLGDQGMSKSATELVATLDFMPLAIVQAAAYISQRAPRCSVQQYLEDFQKSDRKKTRLLNYEGGQLRRDWEAKNSVINTWEISFDYIRQIRRSAADLISLMSFFDRQGIPETVVRNVKMEQSRRGSQVDNTDSEKDSDGDSEPESIEDDGFEDDILMLRNYSLISVNTDKSTFEMHRLVQLATREWLRAHGELERWKQQFIKNLSAEFPPGKYENWYLCQSLFPHVRSALSQQPTEKQAYLLDNAAWYAGNKGNIPEAETMSVQALRTRKKYFGEEHPGTVNSMAILAIVYSIGGRWNEAKELRVQVVEIMKRTVGEDHQDTLTDMSNLASTYWHQGQWKESEELNIHVMDARRRVLGPDHLDTLMSMNNLATTNTDQGKLKEAEELLIHVLEARKRVLGAEHPDTLTSLDNLASNYMRQGRWEEAEELLIHAMEKRMSVLGIEHPATLVSLNNVAAMYMDQGRYKEAEELGLQAIEISKRVLGANHPDTLTCIAHLTSVLRYQARWDEARELDVQSLESMKDVFGPEHPHTLTCMNYCALTLEGLGQAAEAIEQMEQCVELQTRVLGPDHRATITSSAVLNQWKVARLNIDTPEAEK
jgi:tetratricopeptide (TPR) repeat protein